MTPERPPVSHPNAMSSECNVSVRRRSENRPIFLTNTEITLVSEAFPHRF